MPVRNSPAGLLPRPPVPQENPVGSTVFQVLVPASYVVLGAPAVGLKVMEALGTVTVPKSAMVACAFVTSSVTGDVSPHTPVGQKTALSHRQRPAGIWMLAKGYG